MNDVYISVGKYGLLSEVIDAVDSELKNRDDVVNDKEEDNIYVDSDVIDNVINLIKLEDKMYDLFNSLDFNSSEYDFTTLYEFSLLEKELVDKIEISSSLIGILNDLLNNNMWIYLSGDVKEKSYVISHRLTNILPFYIDLKISPSQKRDSYNFIYRNHLIRSLNDLWAIKEICNDENIKKGFEQVFKRYYFINPILTDEYISLNGSYNCLFDLPSNLSGLDDLEYEYDENEQLFILGCDIISYLFDNEKHINYVIDYCEFQFKINELLDIISKLSNEYNKKLYRYLMDYSSFFSPLRRDIRKIFKDKFNNKVKSINR